MDATEFTYGLAVDMMISFSTEFTYGLAVDMMISFLTEHMGHCKVSCAARHWISKWSAKIFDTIVCVKESVWRPLC